MRTLFDVNALLAVFDTEHVFHARARRWWAANLEGGWATCPLTQNGFVRIMSQPSYSRRRQTADAATVLRAGVSEPSHEFWPDDLSIVDAAIVNSTYLLGPNQITDVYLLALAVKHGGRLATFDRGIPLAAVHGAEARHLAVI